MKCVCGYTEFHTSMSDDAIIKSCPKCGDSTWVIPCHCGGDEVVHHLGSVNCYRERVMVMPRKISSEKDKWFVDGHVITGTTLREQRGYHQHSCGKWSRPKDHESCNSLPDET